MLIPGIGQSIFFSARNCFFAVQGTVLPGSAGPAFDLAASTPDDRDPANGD